jgi:hypothetical protein
LHKIATERPTFKALLEHPWLLPLSTLRPDWAEVESSNKSMLGAWVIDSIAKKDQAKEERGSDLADEEQRVKPPLHTVVKETDNPQ